jgi:hypothetical protein
MFISCPLKEGLRIPVYGRQPGKNIRQFHLDVLLVFFLDLRRLQENSHVIICVSSKRGYWGSCESA